MAWTRIFYVTDLHGSETCFRKFLNSAKVYGAPYLVSGGDITGKAIAPILKDGPASWHCRYMSSELKMSSQEELASTVKTIAGSGFYPLVIGPDEYEAMTKERAEALFYDLIRDRLRQWLALAAERLGPQGVKGFIMPGNDDFPLVDEVLNEAGAGPSGLENSDGKVVRFGDFEMVSVGYANITPWNCPRDVPEEELAGRIDQAVSQVQDFRRCIFNFHCPPLDSQLDSAPELDAQLRPKLLSGGEMKMVPVGSRAVREAIERYQPLLAFHGHIHESRGTAKIGKTVCINPGSEYQTGVLRGVLVSLGPKGQLDWALTAG